MLNKGKHILEAVKILSLLLGGRRETPYQETSDPQRFDGPVWFFIMKR